MTHQVGPRLVELQKQVLYGTILGGSSIIRPERGKNCYLAMRDHQYLWLWYKIQALRDFFKLSPSGEVDPTAIKKDKNTYRCYSVAFPIFNDVYNLFYKDGTKIVTREILEVLSDEAWMVWFVDAGRKSKRKAYLRTHKFGEEGTQIIAEYFNSLNCFCEAHRCRGRHEIVFSNKGAFELLRVLAPCLPDFLAKDD